MSEIIKVASAGTLESSDVYVEIEPWNEGIRVEVESVVKEQFGDAIEAVVLEVLEQSGVAQEIGRAHV